jgi:hypothetical protein
MARDKSEILCYPEARKKGALNASEILKIRVQIEHAVWLGDGVKARQLWASALSSADSSGRVEANRLHSWVTEEHPKIFAAHVAPTHRSSNLC